jgi:antitoxin Phd
MIKEYSIAEARQRLPQVVREAEAGETVTLTRRGQRVVVLVGTDQFDHLSSGRLGFSKAYARFREHHDLDELELDPAGLFAGLRDRSPGREVDV